MYTDTIGPDDDYVDDDFSNYPFDRELNFDVDDGFTITSDLEEHEGLWDDGV